MSQNKQLLHQQEQQIDVVLDDMSGSLDRLKTTALTTQNELRSQNSLIDDVSDEVDTNASRLKKTTATITRMLETMSCIPYRSTGCIVILVVIICILVLLLIFG